MTAPAKAAFAVVLGTLCAACVPIPIPAIWEERPPHIVSALPTEFSSGEKETLVLAVRRDRAPGGGAPTGVYFSRPLFAEPADLPALAKKLEQSGWGLAGIIMVTPVGLVPISSDRIGPPPVTELCVIAANAHTVSLQLTGKEWSSSDITMVDAIWRDTFAGLLSRPPKASGATVTVFPVWKSSPCKQIDWTREIRIDWTNEERGRVSSYLRELPTQ